MRIPVVVERLSEDRAVPYSAYPVPRVVGGHGETVQAALADLRVSVPFRGETGFTPPTQTQVVMLDV